MSDRINILLVDDEQRNLDALEAILDDPGYRLLRADEADTALRHLLDNDVAAIVLDIKMPVVSGFELANLIKGTKRFRQIPIVFLTAYLLDDRDVLTGYGAGAVDYLTKPVNPDILRHKVAIFADLFRKTRALAELNEHLERRVQERTQELASSEEALRAASTQKDLFLATLAHELRNPLAPLRTGLDILLQQPQRPDLEVATLTAMNRQLTHMVRLIDDLLDVTRISRGTLEVRRDNVALLRVLERAIETSQPLTDRRKQSVVIDAEPGVNGLVDATRIAQVVSNLLNNASKHSPEGATIHVQLRRKNDMAQISVMDRGVGIPNDQLERVFNMFTKIERSLESTNDGLGIGLALSRQLAELHGGSLAVASPGEGEGATFTLSVPLAEQGAPVVLHSQHPGPATNDGSALRIVIVEDNEDAADLMASWLERQGHKVQVARTGPDGLATILAERPDVVLCDVGLPEMDGVEVCQRVLAALPTPPLMVALTGWGMEADRQRTASAGFAHHLVKPVAMNELRTILQSVRPALELE